MNTRVTRRRWAGVLAGLLPVLLLGSALGSAQPGTTAAVGSATAVDTSTKGQRAVRLTVMTRNLYLGAGLEDALTARTFGQLVRAATRIFAQVRRNDFAERAGAIAEEIADHEPHLVGLQEVSLWRSGPFDPDAPARSVELDYLQILLAALSARGLDYAPVPGGVVANIDVEAPRCTGTACAPRDLRSLRDIRLTDRDVVLARVDLAPQRLAVTTVEAANFDTFLTLPAPGGSSDPVQVRRGYVAVDARLRGRSVRVVNTHLEAVDPRTNRRQARELLRSEAVATTSPVVLVGDLNNVTASGESTGTLERLTRAGFVDAWSRARGDEPGPTCCESEDLAQDPPGAAPDLARRIDLVLVGGQGLRARTVERTGVDPGDRTRSGLWASDHAGVVARVLLR